MYQANIDKLTKVADEYLTNGFAKVAALLAAGYSENYSNHTGLKLFDNDRLKAIISQKQQKLALKTEITAEYILNGIKAIADDSTTSATEKLRAFELLGKKLALWIEKTTERRITEYVPVSIQDEAQLLQRRQVRCEQITTISDGIDGMVSVMPGVELAGDMNT